MRSTSICLVLVVCLGAGVVCVHAETPLLTADAIPLGLSSYSSRGAATAASFAGEDHAFYFQSDSVTAPSGEPQSYWPVLYSALMPGLGELTMGYEKRGIALMAVEVAAWAGYFKYHSDGLDERDAYEAFADQYWTQRKFIDDHYLVYPQTGQTQEYLEEQGQAVSGSGGDWWTGYIPWVSKEDDKQHYYENIGKYDWFVSGWSDYDPTIDPPLANSALREEYRSMRGESNDDLDTANSFVWVSLLTRVFSIAETAIIVHNRREDSSQSSVHSKAPIALRARPRGFDGGELALEVRFK